MKAGTKMSVMAVCGFFEAAVAMVFAAQFQPPVLIESPEPEREGWFGVASSVPDVNGDGRPEILICPGGEGQRSYLYDGLLRRVILELTGDWGRGIDDVTGDGRGDLVLSSGLVRFEIRDGTTGALIYTLEPVETTTTEVRAVSSVPDVNGDGRPEIVIAVADYGTDPQSRVVKVFDGASGVGLGSLSGAGLGEGFGEPRTVSGIPDVNGDGRGDVIVGAPLGNKAHIFDGATGAILRTLTGSGGFGRAVTGLNDVTGDGRGDVVVTAVDSRRAYILDGANGTLLRTLRAPDNPAFFGWVLNRLPDIDGDGHDDVVVGPPHAPNAQQRRGNVYLFSGMTGELLATLPGHAVGGSASGVPDLNGDGLGEVLVADPRADSTDGVYQAGQVRLHLSAPSPPRLLPSAPGPEGFKFQVIGRVGSRFELQRSEDLANWIPLGTQVLSSNTVEFLDTDTKGRSRHFYRTRTMQ